MKVGFLQFHPQFKKVKENLEKIESLILDGPRADLVVLPELATTGYAFHSLQDILDLCQPLGISPEINYLTTIAKKRSSHLICGLPEVTKKGIYNSAVWISPKGIMGVYRKIHLFMHERDLFLPGNIPPIVWNIEGVNVGVMICFDWYFPEIARCLMLKKAQVIAHPSNLVLPHCQQVMTARCLENKVFSITANRIGTETDIEGKCLTFTGQSQIVNPQGHVLKQASVDNEYVWVTSIDPNEALNKNITPYNNILLDRRPDLYPDLWKEFNHQ